MEDCLAIVAALNVNDVHSPVEIQLMIWNFYCTFVIYFIPKQQPDIKAQATKAPALAPDSLPLNKCGAYSFKQVATPTW